MGPSQWALEAVDGKHTGKRFRVTDRGFTLGREADNDLVLMDDNISRHHAIVRLSRDLPVLEDRNSRNGTYVNSQKVSRATLKSGDRIALGTHLFKVVSVDDDEAALESTDNEQTVVARPSPAQLRRTQAVQVFDPIHPEESRSSLAQELLPGDVERGADSPPMPEVGWGTQDGDGPIFGGAAAAAPAGQEPGGEGLPPSGAVETSGPQDGPVAAQPDGGEYLAGFAQDPLLDTGATGQPSMSRRLLPFVVGGVAVMLCGGAALYFLTSQGPGTLDRAASLPEQVAPVRPSDRFDDLFKGAPGASDGKSKRIIVLSAEEELLPLEERQALADEHFDQGERYMNSDKLTSALEEFEKALALNADCKICVIRISKAEAEIEKLSEKYKGDALRSYQAMEYRKAKHYWELVLELERDPDGRTEAMEGLRDSVTQLRQQSYR